MSIPKETLGKLSVKNGRFILRTKTDGDPKVHVRYPKVELKSNRIKVGCITVTKEAAKILYDMLDIQHTGVVQEEGIQHHFEPVYDLPDIGYKVVKA